MPIDDPKKVNKAMYWDENNGYTCRDCALRLVDGDETELPSDQIRMLVLPNCAECLAFAGRRHPAMFSDVRTILEIEAEIAALQDKGMRGDAPDLRERVAKVDALEWVLGIGRHANG